MIIEFLLLGIPLTVVGIVFFCKPQWLWELTERWKSYNADEPSDFYIMSTKLGGIMMSLAGLASIVAFIFIRQ